jgi:sugar/nucleoside kinase (ribokinase family)
LLDLLYLKKEDMYLLPSRKTTMIRNQYLSADNERRTCTALSIADPFRIEDIPDVSSEIYHLAGLIAGDFDSDIIKQLSMRGKVAVDVQGFIRTPVNGEMVFMDWKEKKECLPYIHYLKTDAAEAEILTGCSKTRDAAKILFEWGAKEVMITHYSEVIVYDGKNMYSCPLKPRNLSGRTGRGDTCFSAYITERIRKDKREALLYAAALVSLKIEIPGPFKGNRDDVVQYIKEFYNDGCRME